MSNSDAPQTTIAMLCECLAPFAALGKPSAMDGWSGDTEKVSRADCMAAYRMLAMVERLTADDAVSQASPPSVSQQTVQAISEPDIIVNGVRLGPAEAMTMRVALEGFSSMLSQGLGDDEHGRAMTMAYGQSITRIRQKMYRG